MTIHVLRAAALISLLSLAFAGCTHLVVSTSARPCTDQACDRAGFVYSLPKGQVLLQASRKPATPQDLAPYVAAVAAANETVKKSQATLDAASKKLADDTEKKALEETINADKKAKVTAEAALETDQGLLNYAKANLDRQIQMQGRGIESATLTLLPVVPDPTARYVANLAHSPLRDDNFKITVSNGLLTTANTTSTDQTLTSFVKLAEAAISVATFVSSGIPLLPEGGERPAAPTPLSQALAAQPKVFPVECTYEIAEVFDPLNPKDVKRVKDILKDRNANLTLETVPEAPKSEAKSGQKSEQKPAPAPAPAQGPPARGAEPIGLKYRVVAPVVVSVKPREKKDDKDWSKNDTCPLQAKPGAQALLATVPDSRSDFAIAVTAGPFTTTQLTYGFSNGMLTDFSANRPSEVAALVDVPAKLAQDIVAIPGSILKLRVDYTAKSSELVKAETALINDQSGRTVASLNAQKALAEARASLIKAQLGVPEAFAQAEQDLIKAQQALEKLMSSTPVPGSTTPDSGAK
jgi:hypothetical protein